MANIHKGLLWAAVLLLIGAGKSAGLYDARFATMLFTLSSGLAVAFLRSRSCCAADQDMDDLRRRARRP